MNGRGDEVKKRKNALLKDFYMEIRKSMGRFLSIFFIVALGVSLFSGIKATEPDMRLSGDAYVDENKLMDVKVMSTYGLTDDDVDVIGRLPAIDTVEGAYSVDVLCKAGEDMEVLHVMSKTESMNKITIEEGRLPKSIDECLVDQDFMKSSGYKLGDTITLESGTDADLTDTLDGVEFTIVGSGNSPLYFALDRGSSTVGNGSVSGFVVVHPSAFCLDVYTEIFATVDGAEEVQAFSEEYDELIEEAIEQIQLIQNVRCEVRRNELAENAQLEIDSARKELNTKKSEAEDEISKNETDLKEAELEIKLSKLQIEQGKAEIASAKAELESGKQQLEQIRNAYSQAIGELEKQKKSLEDQIANLEAQLEKVEDATGQANLQTSINRLKESLSSLEQQIDSVTKEFDDQIAAAEKEIADGEKLLLEKEAELKKAERQLKKAEAEIASGKTQIEDAKTEMETQIQEGEDKLADAEEEVSKIELPVWYVFDRSSIPEYSGYGDNADRIAALAIVFPSIFFLVAALISLTTMTRMVEEQRGQIGTLKALGYSKRDIMMKYICYALLATVGGSLFGVLVGEKLYPYVIIVAYKIMYVHIPQVLIPYHWGYGLTATAIAVACTGVATITACYKELIAQPAVLMRPEAPQAGKRTWIEKIPFLWKHLNFTWKSSLRNLFRYKKRFFMTLFGIGGCMGLLLVGYGLRDSIMIVADYQYSDLQTYDASVFLSEDMEENTRTNLEDYLSENKEVTNYTSVRMESVTAQNDDNEVDIYLTVIEDVEHVEEFFSYHDRVSKEKYKLSNKGIIMAEKTADMLGVKVGDTVVLSQDGKNEKKVEITAICENYVSHYVYMTTELYEEVYDESPFYNSLLIKADVEMDELEKIGEEILKYEDILNVQYTANLSSQLDGMLGALDQVMIVLIVVAGMLSFVVLYNLNNININERRRELATLKVLGFYDIEVANYVYRENILLTLFGTIVGCGMGKFLHLFTITTVEVDAAMFGREISAISYLICALITCGFSAFVNWIMYFKLKKINMVESLKSVE